MNTLLLLEIVTLTKINFIGLVRLFRTHTESFSYTTTDMINEGLLEMGVVNWTVT